MAVSKRVRFEAFKRDRFTCQYCGKRPPDVTLEIDHVVARREGGADDIHNLTTSCVACNRGKSGVPLDKVAPALDEMEVLSSIQEMLERRQALRSGAVVANALRQAEDEAIALVRSWWQETFDYPENHRRANYFNSDSVRYFIKKLELHQIRDAIDCTLSWEDKEGYYMGGDRLFKYFCAVCWNRIRAGEPPTDANG